MKQIIIPASFRLFFLFLGFMGYAFYFASSFEVLLKAWALDLPFPWLAAFLFYLIPFGIALVLSTITLRCLQHGSWLVMGSLFCSSLLLIVNWPAYFSCGAFGRCGTCSMGWFSSVGLLPSALGQMAALRHASARTKA